MSVDYAAPTTVAEALSALDAWSPNAEVVAGGTDLVVGVRSGKRGRPSAIVSVHDIAELRGSTAATGSLRLNALATHAEVVADAEINRRWTALADASRLVGSPATRNVGTVAGNVANASPAMDTGSPLLVFEAAVEVRSASGQRTIPLDAFFVGPGRNALAPGELIVGIDVPAPPAGGSAYLRLGYRRAMEIAVVGAAAFVAEDADGVCTEARVALTAVAPTCFRVPELEAQLVGERLTPERIRSAARQASAAARPIGDVRASAGYRRGMVAVIVERALATAVARARDEAGRDSDDRSDAAGRGADARRRA